ncbi:DUF1853 family protein [Formosa haliotis]|uniref:DUF1853 family protein n=1 Tax=Formosa haliotis TaxID=1555194 RepID=UPI00082562C8|nr:DUF1853 family protein [Formosa haliotis]
MTENEKQYHGYFNTPLLWTGKNSLELEQFKIPNSNFSNLNIRVEEGLRLGKLVEQFVFFELNQCKNIDFLAENLQIQKDKTTLGEIDCILRHHNTLYHIEIVYKFYLYDPKVGQTEFEHWIGPNRKDSFIEKINKLKHKQLPLLYKQETQNQLEALGISTKQLQQRVLFKAQLFLPLTALKDVFKELNPDCVTGFYISYSEVHLLSTCKFFIPKKVNWLCDIETQIPWLSFSNFLLRLEPLIAKQIAPLCWIKYPNGITKKCFVVWWT